MSEIIPAPIKINPSGIIMDFSYGVSPYKAKCRCEYCGTFHSEKRCESCGAPRSTNER